MPEIYKIRLKNGEHEVEIESSERAFVEEKLHLYAISELGEPVSQGSIQNKTTPTSSLAKFLKDQGAQTNQMKKFLATAVYLSVFKGKKNLKIIDITSALKDAGQTKISNPSMTLMTNISHGRLERTGNNEFMVTVHGLEFLGIEV